jgi:hypothetical protein
MTYSVRFSEVQLGVLGLEENRNNSSLIVKIYGVAMVRMC